MYKIYLLKNERGKYKIMLYLTLTHFGRELEMLIHMNQSFIRYFSKNGKYFQL